MTPMASRAARDNDRDRRVTGSMNAPTIHSSPITAQTAPGTGFGSQCRATAAVTAANGIGHGAATAAP
jgi:hypothetical protein